MEHSRNVGETKMNEQMSIFDLLPSEQCLKPGEWIEEDMLGEK